MEIAFLKQRESASQRLHHHRWCQRLGKDAAPRYITRVSRMHIRKKLTTNDRAYTVGAYDEVGLDALAAGKLGDAALVRRGHAQALMAVMVAVIWKSSAELVKHRVPRG